MPTPVLFVVAVGLAAVGLAVAARQLTGRWFWQTPVAEPSAADLLARKFLDAYLRTVPLDRLASYPGVGPATLAKLRDAGATTAADVFDRTFPGVNRKQSADLAAAIANLVSAGFAAPVPPPPPPDLFAAAPAKREPTAPNPGLARMRAVVRFAVVVAKADGKIAAAERKLIRSATAAVFGHDPVLARHLDPLIEQTIADTPAEATATSEAVAALTPSERLELYALAEKITLASGERNSREDAVLARAAAAFGVPAPAPVAAPPPVAPAPPPPPAGPPDLRHNPDLDDIFGG